MNRLNIIYAFILVGLFSCSNDIDERSRQIIQNVKSEFASDSRTALFEVEAIGSDPVLLKGETNLEAGKIELLNSFKSAGIQIKDEISILPNEKIGDKKFALITVSVANLRANPRHSAELVTQALLGTPVKVLKEQHGWYLIQTPDNYISWTNGSSLERIDLAQLEAWKNSEKVIYLSTYGFSLTADENERVSDLVTGSVFTIENETDNYYEVSYPDGRMAKIAKDEARVLKQWKEDLIISENSISEASLDLLGIPYLWGGTSTKSLDCSGFTKTVYLLHGLVIPRDASQQVLAGELVDIDKDFSKLKIGDLLFFGSKNEDQSERVVHVGLWLGNNEFIHASGDVHISSMDSLSNKFDAYNFNRYLRTKRFLGSKTDHIYELSNFYN